MPPPLPMPLPALAAHFFVVRHCCYSPASVAAFLCRVATSSSSSQRRLILLLLLLQFSIDSTAASSSSRVGGVVLVRTAFGDGGDGK
ncbi:hypothetical protein PIB30_061164 [Stylosanthes scabra]|uniref:Secreted protein n=1 Tax=Stylosanthes scabra TaxID=79078 RepID=A0ABU6ZJG4_9FABA|nr:hypothetical protein [Stylosanthes scabra]